MTKKDNQINLFGEEDVVPELKIIRCNNQESDSERKEIYEFKYIGCHDMTEEDLFKGYDTLKVLTYTYDFRFLNRISKLFKHIEVIIGAEFNTKSKRQNDDLVNIFANGNCVVDTVVKFGNLRSLMRDGNMALYVAQYMVDHRKIYILSSDSGKTRVIFGSPNATSRGWGNNQIEFTGFDDSPNFYEKMDNSFETSLCLAVQIPYEMLPVDKNTNTETIPEIQNEADDNETVDDNLLENNVIISKAKKIDTMVFISNENDEQTIDRINYCINIERLRNVYSEISAKVIKSSKNGICEIHPKDIKRITTNFKTMLAKKKISVNNINKEYPSLTFDLEEQKAFIDNTELDLNPSADEIMSDVSLLLGVFKNFDDFVDTSGQLKKTHFKMLNAIFASPLFPIMRCIGNAREVGISSMPLYLLAYSGNANCGKTFMMSLILKMMSGRVLKGYSIKDFKSQQVYALLCEKKR